MKVFGGPAAPTGQLLRKGGDITVGPIFCGPTPPPLVSKGQRPVTMTIYSCKGKLVWTACNLTAFTPCLTGPVDYPFASRHQGPGFNTGGGGGGYFGEIGLTL